MNKHPLVAVVDDSESVRESLPDLLQEVGFAVQTFASAEAFLASEAADETSCLILDVGLPRMSGPDLQLELIRRGKAIPVIFITAQGDQFAPSTSHRRRGGRVLVQAIQRHRAARSRRSRDGDEVSRTTLDSVVLQKRTRYIVITRLRYPITATVFILMHKSSSRGRTAAALDFFRWSLERGGSTASHLGYVPLPASLADQVRKYWSDAFKSGS